MNTHSEKPVKILYFTDPICSTCWGIEPQMRRLKLEFGEFIDIEYYMGGLLPSWEGFNSGGITKPADACQHWEEVSINYGMPMIGDVWLNDPLLSSYPPSISFKAAQMQDYLKSIKFLRRLREMVFVEAKNIARPEIIAEAATWAGLDSTQLETDSKGKALELFEEDLQKAREMGVRGFPTIFVQDSTDNRITIYGVHDYEEFSDSIQSLAPHAKPKVLSDDPLVYFDSFKSLTAKELSCFLSISINHAIDLLTETEKEGITERITAKSADLWRLK